MLNLFNQRLQSHFSQISKYLKYVFNDFFVIALMFIIGGIGYQYAQFIKTLAPGLWWEKIVLLILILLSVQINGLVTFIKKADFVFWLPKEKSFYNFFIKSLRYSRTIAVSVQIIIWFMMIPFIEKTYNSMNAITLIMMLLAMICIKWIILNNQMTSNYYVDNVFINNAIYYRMIIPLIQVLVLVFVNAYLGVAISLIILIMSQFMLNNLKSKIVNWQAVIENEESHENRLNRFFNMFTDVENMQGIVKRRKYLDFIYTIFDKDVYSTLYSRGIIRDKEISGLLVRISILGAIFIGSIKIEWVSIVIGMLFIYLIVFQLVPFFNNFSDNVFVSLYPIDLEKRIQSFSRVVSKIMIIIVILFMIGSIFMFNLMASLILFIVLILESFILVKLYIPRKVRKASSNY